MKVRDVEAKHISGFGNLFVRDDFKDNIEEPCLAACLYLYDLNIRTMSTNCNKEDPEVYLYIDFESLSDENKEIARNLAKNSFFKLDEIDKEHLNCGIRFQATLDDNVEDISNKLMAIVQNFQYQDVLSNKFRITERDYLKNVLSFIEYGNQFQINNDGVLEVIDYETEEEAREKGKIVVQNLQNEYEDAINKGLVDSETGDVFLNLELAQKHQKYIELQKGKNR